MISSIHEIASVEISFRLLNSEIGNDPDEVQKRCTARTSFRLLNSEIGNDQRKTIQRVLRQKRFSSP